MGSWNETCALSHLPILPGDETVKLLCYSGYQTELLPVTLPVVGGYDDYGDIEGDWLNHPQWGILARYFWPIAKENWRKHVIERHQKDVRGIWRQAKGPEVAKIAKERDGLDTSTFEGLHTWVIKASDCYAKWVREGTITGINPKRWEEEPEWSFLKLGYLTTKVSGYSYKHRYQYVLIRKSIWDAAVNLGRELCEKRSKDRYYQDRENPWLNILKDPTIRSVIGDRYSFLEGVSQEFLEKRYGVPKGVDPKSPQGLRAIIDTSTSGEFGFHLDQTKSPVLHNYHEIMGPTGLQTTMLKGLLAYPLAEGKELDPKIMEGFRELFYLRMFLQETRQAMHPVTCGSQQDLTRSRVKFHQAIGREIKKIRKER